MGNILVERLKNADRFWLLDGAMGTQLQKRGLPTGLAPEVFNITHPQVVTDIHREYIAAGSNIIYANTFGANRKKLEGCGYSVEEIITAAVNNAKEAAGTNVLVAMDIGPIGELLEPAGTLGFEEAYGIFYEEVCAGINAGADLIVLETMTDLYEVKAGILAAKDGCAELGKQLPIMVSMSFEANGRTFTGCCVPSMAAVIEGLGADIIGFNCSLGPVEILPLVKELRQYTSLPIFVKPNAGLPDPQTGLYSIGAEEFAACLEQYIGLGVNIFGGCCGTSPEFINAVGNMLGRNNPVKSNCKSITVPCVCTPTDFVPIDRVRIIGERINPTGKKRLKQAIAEQDFDYILRQGIEQVQAGADILDVNMGMPGIDESMMLPLVVKKLQSVLGAPLQIDSANADAVEKALRIYNGKPIVNSVNGNEKSMETILPLVKKYGAAVVALTLDDNGIPLTAEERFAIAQRIVKRADEYGIARENIFVDCLTLTASVQQKEVVETLKAMRMVKERLGVKTVLGVSNISFGLPNRELLNQSFLLMALQAGLDLPIINPNVQSMTDAVRAYEVLYNIDQNSARYIEHFSSADNIAKAAEPMAKSEVSDITDAVKKGLGEEVRKGVAALLNEMTPEEIINQRLIPALDEVGKDFETGKIFLPQMIQSAQASQAGFEEIKNYLASNPAAERNERKGKIVIATVHGDVHDIGKNIVKVILENYGFKVIDLGRDVPAERVVEAARDKDVKLVGLSALMTTTLISMEETIKAIRAAKLDCKIMVGGAVLTEDYAMKIGADFYARDAKQSADIARMVV